VAAAFRQLRAGLAGVNLEIPADKCKVYAPAGPDADLLTVNVDADDEESQPLSLPVVEGGCIVMGVPMVKHKRHYTALLLLSMCVAPTVNHLLLLAAQLNASKARPLVMPSHCTCSTNQPVPPPASLCGRCGWPPRARPHSGLRTRSPRVAAPPAVARLSGVLGTPQPPTPP
jgi:hypothetical protein